MYKTLILDIETVGTSRQDVIDYIAATVKPPATYKKAESIEAWHKEQGPDAIAEAVAKTGLDGAFGQAHGRGVEHRHRGRDRLRDPPDCRRRTRPPRDALGARHGLAGEGRTALISDGDLPDLRRRSP